MRLFLDTANIEHIRHGVQMGVVSGVTTNPTLVSHEGQVDFKAHIRQICTLVPGPVSSEVLSTDAEGMIREARIMSTWADNIVVKIPSTIAGLQATSTLAREGVKVNMTLCFSLNQAILAAEAGAAYISPFVGRLDDIGEDGMALVVDIVNYLRYHTLLTQVIVASIRHPAHCLSAAKAGAHIATVPYKILLQMMQHPLTDIGMRRFADDWQTVMGENFTLT